MNYTEALGYVHSRLRFGSRPGLDSIKRITDLCGCPQKSGMRFIHVAGTNGKGSTATMIYNILRAFGRSVGLYISPYVTDFCERIQINGHNIGHKMFADVITRLRPLCERLEQEGVIVTEFELITAAALCCYAECGCEYVVLEVGMGGRFDATNIIDCPEVSVITHIDIDHSAVLGDTVEQIAYEKCGIIKGGVTVCYPQQYDGVMAAVRERCRLCGSKLTVPDMQSLTACELSADGSRFDYGGLHVRLPLIGRHQVYNAVTAIEAARAVGVSERAIASGIADTFMPARLEVLHRDPTVILDGSHNPDGVGALADTLGRLLGGRKVTAVIGMLADKDCSAAMAKLMPLCDSVITVTVPNPRTMTAAELARTVRPMCGRVTVARSQSEALRLAREQAEGRPIVICGSLYLAASIRRKACGIYK